MKYVTELRQALRRTCSRRQIGAVAIMALGLALAAVMFTIGWGYSSFRLPYRDAERLVAVDVNMQGSLRPQSAVEENLMAMVEALHFAWSPEYTPGVFYFACRERADIFDEVAAFAGGGDEVRIKTERGNAIMNVMRATPNIFALLGVSAPGLPAWQAIMARTGGRWVGIYSSAIRNIA